MKYASVLFFALFGLLACQTTAEKTLSVSPISVEEHQLYQFWRPVINEKKFTPNTLSRRKPQGSGWVVAQYLIDSNGNVFDVEILEAEPRGMWESTATKQLRNYQYRAAKNNAQKTPVYVTTRVFFTAEQVDIYR